jgi:DNA-binding MarR family transcriptional regulator
MHRAREESPERSRIMLGLLDAVDQDRAQSQRLLASELGIALGLVNAYLKRCIKKGLVKVRSAPTRRYAYYLTPQGFAEKSRLTVEYLSSSFDFFRQARSDCSQIFERAKANGLNRMVLVGHSDLAEIAAICALQSSTSIIAVCDRAAAPSLFFGIPVVASYDDVPEPLDAVVITDLLAPFETCRAAVARFGHERVLVPNLLRIGMRAPKGRVS